MFVVDCRVSRLAFHGRLARLSGASLASRAARLDPIVRGRQPSRCGFLHLGFQPLKTGLSQHETAVLQDQLALEHGAAGVDGQLAGCLGVDRGCDLETPQVDQPGTGQRVSRT